MGHCQDCGEDIDELAVSDTRVTSGVVYECPACSAIVGVADATDI